MKPKNFWETELGDSNPFQLPSKISQGLNAVVRDCDPDASPESVVRYLWIYVNEDGVRRRTEDFKATGKLRLDDWLNVIDESASLGVEWMVVHAGVSLCQCPEVWKFCEWAQSEHQLHVGLHVNSASLSEDDIEHLTQLDGALTYIIGDQAVLDQLRPLRDRGIQFCEASVLPIQGKDECANPEELVCVGIDGRLFTCGLVLGEKEYDLGSVLERGLKDVLQDKNLPRFVANTADHPAHGCDGCPPHVAQRVSASLEQ